MKQKTKPPKQVSKMRPKISKTKLFKNMRQAIIKELDQRSGWWDKGVAEWMPVVMKKLKLA